MAALARGERRMVSFYPGLRVRAIQGPALAALDPAGLAFFNLNTPDDLQRAEDLLQELEAQEQSGIRHGYLA